MIELRDYQHRCAGAFESHWRLGGGPALASVAMGAGKSIVIAEITRRELMRNDSTRVLILMHVRELIEQNVAALLAVWPDAPYGICSAGLGRRDFDGQIVLGSIQTLYREPRLLGRRDLIIIDEAHLVPRDGDGMYLSLLDALRAVSPGLRLIGLSATCYRLDSGYLDRGEDALFEKTVFDYGIGEAIRDGWLCPLSSKATATRIDVSGVHRRGGEFIADELARACNVVDVVEGAADEIVARGAGRRGWLAFCAGVEHALHVRDALRQRGIIAETVTGETPSAERAAIFAAFRAGDIRCLTGVNVFSVGFDVPHVDLIALLRPTCSTGLYVQQLGRGTRLAPGKSDCLALDFAGNVRRHGPVDAVRVKAKAAATPGAVLTKVCPECAEENLLAARVCVACGHEFVAERAPRHGAVADVVDLLSSKPEWLPVRETVFRVHHKAADPNAPPTLRADHWVGFSSYSEWVAFESFNNYARGRAGGWWWTMGGERPVPATVDEALRRVGELGRVLEVIIERDGEWRRVGARWVEWPNGRRVEIDRNFNARQLAI